MDPKNDSSALSPSPAFQILNQEITTLNFISSSPMLTGAINEKILNILNIIVNNGNYWNVFKKWTKEKISRQKLDRSDVKKIQAIVQKGLCLKESQQILCERLKAADLLHQGVRIGQPVPASFILLKDFDQHFLKAAVTKNYKELRKVIFLLEKYQALQPNSPKEESNLMELQTNLKIWILQYLVRGSKIPLLEQRGPIHLPFMEFLSGESNTAEYYRFEGGAITRLFMDFVKNKHQFPENSNIILDVIRVGCFPDLCQAICTSQKMKMIALDAIPTSLDQFVLDADEETFYDLTPLLQNLFTEGGGGPAVDTFVNQMTSACRDCQKSLKFGGVLNLDNQDCYILFPAFSMEETVAPSFARLRGSLGLVPEMVGIRRALIEAGFSLTALLQHCPPSLLSQPLQPIEMTGSIREVTKSLQNILNNKPP